MQVVQVQFNCYLLTLRSRNNSRSLETGEEGIYRYRLIDGELMIAGTDSTDADELTSRPLIEGNFLELETDNGKSIDPFKVVNMFMMQHDSWRACGSRSEQIIVWNGITLRLSLPMVFR